MSEAIWGFIAIIVAVTVVLAVVSSVGTQIYLQRQDEVRTRRALAHAIAAEITAYLDLVERRRQLEYAEETLNHLRAGKDIKLPSFVRAHDTPLSPFLVMNANAANFGRLGELTADVVQFYSLVLGVRTTMLAIKRGDFNDATREEKINVLAEEIREWKDAVLLGRRVSEKLRVS